LCVVLFSNHSFGQNLTNTDSTSTSNLSFVDKIILKINVDTQVDSYLINDKLTDETITLIPNRNVKLSLSIDYEFLGMSISVSPKFISGNDDNDLKGKTSFTDYRFRFFLGSWTQGLIYSNIQGYYIENTQDFIPNWIEGEDPYIQFPDLKIIKWGGNTSYVLNKEFSLRNVVYQTEWQRKSSGSFIPNVDYSYNRLSNKINGLKSYENAFDIKLAASYYYTLVLHKNWFASAFVSPTIGVRFSNFQDETENGDFLKEKNQHIINELDGGLQLGFSSKKVIFGVNVNVDVNWYDEDKTTNIIDNKVYAKVYFGYRFNPPKVVQKPFNWVNKKLGQ
jgi:hypothetical protein